MAHGQVLHAEWPQQHRRGLPVLHRVGGPQRLGEEFADRAFLHRGQPAHRAVPEQPERVRGLPCARPVARRHHRREFVERPRGRGWPRSRPARPLSAAGTRGRRRRPKPGPAQRARSVLVVEEVARLHVEHLVLAVGVEGDQGQRRRRSPVSLPLLVAPDHQLGAVRKPQLFLDGREDDMQHRGIPRRADAVPRDLPGITDVGVGHRLLAPAEPGRLAEFDELARLRRGDRELDRPEPLDLEAKVVRPRLQFDAERRRHITAKHPCPPARSSTASTATAHASPGPGH